MTRLVIVSGSDAGISAALRARELDPTVEPLLVVADPYPNFSICGIPYHVSGEVPDRRNLAHRSVADLRAAGVDLRLESRAEQIDPTARTLTITTPDQTVDTLGYDQLVVATGAVPVRPPIAGLDTLTAADGVHLLHTMGDTFALTTTLAHHPATALIVGAGYIGLEMAEALRTRRIAVTMVEQLPQVLPTVDPQLATLIEDELSRHEVDVVTAPTPRPWTARMTRSRSPPSNGPSPPATPSTATEPVGHPLTPPSHSMIIDSMNVDRSFSVAVRARIHAALGEPARLAIVDTLILGDASPGELGHALGLPTNLLAHHLGVLTDAGIVQRIRSEGDRRRTYVRLRPEALTTLVAARLLAVPRVVFVCTHNSARSPLAAALWARSSAIPAASAGTEPARRVHPRAVRVGRRHGLGIDAARTAHVRDVLRPDDLVVAVCDNAHEHLPGHPGPRLHWSVPDPAPVDTDGAFETALTDLTTRIQHLAPALQPPGSST